MRRGGRRGGREGRREGDRGHGWEGGEEGARWRGEGGEGEEEGPKPLDRVLWGPVITGAHAPSACIARDQLGFQGSQKDKD